MLRSLVRTALRSSSFNKSGLNFFRHAHQIPEDKVATSGTMHDVKQMIYKNLGLKQGYSPLVDSREHLMRYEPKSYDELPDRSMQDSFTSAIIPLSQDSILQDKYVTFLGSVRIGRLMEDMDLFACWVIHQHLHMPNHPVDVALPYTFVTILVDKMDFTNYLPRYNGDIRLSGHVSWVGKSSIEVVVWLEQQNDMGTWQKLTRALFLFASRNSTNTKALMINRLVPANENEKRILDGGEVRKKRRMTIQQESLLRGEPNDFEQKLIHDIFLSSVDLSDFSFKKKQLPAGAVYMSDTNITNLVLSYPEDRNAHNKIFGGFLMRHALELSWVAAYNFSKKRPTLEGISDISFHKPVNVSSCIKMHAKVIYTEMNYMQIVVIAEVNDPGTNQQYTSNTFYYTYSIDDTVNTVLPKTYSQAMWYLDGRRKFKYAMSKVSLSL